MKLILPFCLVLTACSKPTPSTQASTPDASPLAAAKPSQRAPLEVRVITSPEPLGAVNSTLLIGGDAVVVVDAQFSATGAKKVIDAVKATGKPLTHLFITHGHPDHYLGTSMFKTAFPTASIIASPEVVDDLVEASKTAVPRVKGLLGPEFPGEPVVPERFEADTFSVSGHSVNLLRRLQGDTSPITGLWIESQGVLIASDVAFSGVHAWTADGSAADRASWRNQLRELADRPGLKTVVPGHQLAGSDRSPSVLTSTATYLEAFDNDATHAASAAELIEGMQTRYPDLGGRLFLKIGAGATFRAR